MNEMITPVIDAVDNRIVSRDVVNLSVPRLIVHSVSWITTAQQKVASFRHLANNWNAEGSPPPNATARYWAEQILLQLHSLDFAPKRVEPSAEGGVTLAFYQGGKYGDIECFNSGEILAVVTDDDGEPCIWPVNQDGAKIADAIGRIRDYLPQV